MVLGLNISEFRPIYDRISDSRFRNYFRKRKSDPDVVAMEPTVNDHVTNGVILDREEIENGHAANPLIVDHNGTIESGHMTSTSHVILDCGAIPYVDLMGAKAMIQLHEEYKDVEILVFYANLSG